VSRHNAEDPSPAALSRRLLPMQLGVGLQGFMLWVPVEKLFMTEIGFTAASVGVMAAAYAAVVPLLEVPSGILADRWSRNWLMVLSSLALAASTLVGGLSHNVGTYVVAAMLLGVFFALNSGTVDSIVYDAVLEETGSSTLYERWIGRVRMVEAGALMSSALAGGLLAGWTSPRLTYFATLPFTCLSIVCFFLFREPRLHRTSEPTTLRTHIGLTFRVLTRDSRIRRVLLLAALAALVSQGCLSSAPCGWCRSTHQPPHTARTGRPWSRASVSAATSPASYGLRIVASWSHWPSFLLPPHWHLP
jgi:MFS family permease